MFLCKLLVADFEVDATYVSVKAIFMIKSRFRIGTRDKTIEFEMFCLKCVDFTLIVVRGERYKYH